MILCLIDLAFPEAVAFDGDDLTGLCPIHQFSIQIEAIQDTAKIVNPDTVKLGNIFIEMDVDQTISVIDRLPYFDA